MKKKEENIYDKIAKLMMENNQMVTNKDISNSLNIIRETTFSIFVIKSIIAKNGCFINVRKIKGIDR